MSRKHYSTSKIITVTNGQFTTHEKVKKDEKQAKAAKKAEMKKRFTWSEMLHDDEVDDIWGATPDDQLAVVAEQEPESEPETEPEPEIKKPQPEVIVEVLKNEVNESPKAIETSFDAPDGPSSLLETDFGAALSSDEGSTGVDLDAGSGILSRLFYSVLDKNDHLVTDSSGTVDNDREEEIESPSSELDSGMVIFWVIERKENRVIIITNRRHMR